MGVGAERRRIRVISDIYYHTFSYSHILKALEQISMFTIMSSVNCTGGAPHSAAAQEGANRGAPGPPRGPKIGENRAPGPPGPWGAILSNPDYQPEVLTRY